MSSDTRNLDCEEAIRLLFEYLDDELGRHDHEAMETHIHTCRSCFSRVEFEKRLKHMVQHSSESQAPDALRERIRKLSGRF